MQRNLRVTTSAGLEFERRCAQPIIADDLSKI
jgi:hypothetical protein